MTGRVSAIQIFHEKGMPGEMCRLVKAEAGVGLTGDRHADGGERQISILEEENRRVIDASERKGLCTARFKENLRVEGMDVRMWKVGQQFQFGDAVLEITGSSKRCFPECPLVCSGEICRLKGACVWAKVVGSGTICLNDRIILK